MSSKAKRISKKAKIREINDLFDLYHSTVGSIVCTAAKVSGKDEEWALGKFKELRNNKIDGMSALDLFNMIRKEIEEKEPETKDKFLAAEEFLCFVYDISNVRSPIVTVMDLETGQLLSIAPDGADFGIIRDYNLALKANDYSKAKNIIIEDLYGEDEDDTNIEGDKGL